MIGWFAGLPATGKSTSVLLGAIGLGAAGTATLGPWGVPIVTALIGALPPTVAGLVLLKRLSVVHTAVNSTQAHTVEMLAEAKREIADLRETVGKLKERDTS